MKNIEIIKQELQDFGEKYKACNEILKANKGNNLNELFDNISIYIYWYKDSKEKTIEFNSIFDNKLVIEDDVLLCNCNDANIIVIPNSVTSIGDWAFSSCSGLISITIPSSVTSIGKYAFWSCNPELGIIKI